MSQSLKVWLRGPPVGRNLASKSGLADDSVRLRRWSGPEGSLETV